MLLSVSLSVGVAHENSISQNGVWPLPWNRICLVYPPAEQSLSGTNQLWLHKEWEGRPLTLWASERIIQYPVLGEVAGSCSPGEK